MKTVIKSLTQLKSAYRSIRTATTDARCYWDRDYKFEGELFIPSWNNTDEHCINIIIVAF